MKRRKGKIESEYSTKFSTKPSLAISRTIIVGPSFSPRFFETSGWPFLTLVTHFTPVIPLNPMFSTLPFRRDGWWSRLRHLLGPDAVLFDDGVGVRSRVLHPLLDRVSNYQNHGRRNGSKDFLRRPSLWYSRRRHDRHVWNAGGYSWEI